MLDRLNKLNTGEFIIEQGRILPPEGLGDTYRVGLDGKLSFAQKETGILEWAIKLARYSSQEREWLPAGSITSSGEAFIGPKKALSKKRQESPGTSEDGKTAKAATEAAASQHVKGQKPAAATGFRLNQTMLIDSVPIEFLRATVDSGRIQTLQSKGKWSGHINLEWSKDAFSVNARTRMESVQFLTGKTVLLQGLTIPVEFGFTHNLKDDSFTGLFGRSKTHFGSFNFSAETFRLRNNNIWEAKGMFDWEISLPDLLKNSAYPLSAQGKWNGKSSFHWQAAHQNPLTIDLSADFNLKNFRDEVHKVVLADRIKFQGAYKKENLSAKLLIGNRDGKLEWSVDGNVVPQWMQIVYPYGHRIIVFYQKLDHKVDMTGIHFHKILERLPFIKTWFSEEVVSGQTTGSVDVMFHQTDPYYRYYLLARQRLQARMTNSRIQSQTLPPVNLIVQLEEGFLTFNFNSDAESEKYIKGNINIGLTSYKPVLISEVKGEDWQWFERLAETVGDGVTGQSVDFNIWVNAEGDTLAGFYKSMSYNGVLRFKNPGFTDSSYRKALALNKSDLKRYPSLLKLQEKEQIDFNNMDLRFSFSNGQGRLDGIILERDDLRITGNGNFKPGGERNIYLSGYINDLQNPGQFRLVYEIGNDGKIKKCTLD